MTNSLPVQLIAIDLDGTLLDSHHRLTSGNEAAIRQAVAQGIHVVIATGKTRTSALPILQRLNLTTPGVFLQGLGVFDPEGNLLMQRRLDPDVVHVAAKFADDEDVTLFAYSGMRILARRLDFHSDRLLKYGEPPVEAIGSMVGIEGILPINKMMFVSDPPHMRTLRDRMASFFAGKAELVQSLSNDIEETVEILPVGGSKGAGLMWLLEHMGISSQHVMAIGDGENDIEMIKLARVGVAMANGAPRLKAAADYVTTSNDEDGVARAIERFALNGARGALGPVEPPASVIPRQ